MIKKKYKNYWSIKLLLSLRIKKKYKFFIFKSIIQNLTLLNFSRAHFHILYVLNKCTKTTLIDTCTISGGFKKATRLTNLNRYEFHNLCRKNKLNGWVLKTW